MYQYKITRKEVIVAFAVILFSFSTVYAQTSPMRDRIGRLELEMMAAKSRVADLENQLSLANQEAQKVAALNQEIQHLNRELMRSKDSLEPLWLRDCRLYRARVLGAKNEPALQKMGVEYLEKGKRCVSAATTDLAKVVGMSQNYKTNEKSSEHIAMNAVEEHLADLLSRLRACFE